MVSELVKFLEQFVTDDRKEQFDKVLNERTRYITLALEDIFQSQNASAVLRTSDCFGIQDVHVIENKNQYEINPDVTVGSSKWLNLKKYNKAEENTLETINCLRKEGYRIVATTPHTDDVNLNDFDLSKGKLALFFGTEQTGLSDIVIEHADEYLRIPMFGFTESFNISASAAVILNQLTNKLRDTNINWQLPDFEKEIIKLDWLTTTIKSSTLLVEEFLSMNNKH